MKRCGCKLRPLLLGVSSWLVLAAAPVLSAATNYVALSLGAAQRMAQAAPSDEQFRRADDMGTLVGYVVDDSGDIVLLGTKAERVRPLSLDDLVGLLRAAQAGGLSGPGVSLEPQPGETPGDRLDVVFFGGAAGTSAGLACFAADYLMKRIALDQVSSGVPGIRSYAQLTQEYYEAQQAESWNVLSRFWFTPMFTPVVRDPDDKIFLLRETSIGVMVQMLSAEINGKPAPPSFEDRPASVYADDFIRHYDAVAQNHAEFSDLGRFAGGMKVMTLLLAQAPPDALEHWLRDYHLPTTDIPREVPILRKSFTAGRHQITLLGGVRMAGLTLRLRSGEVAAVRDSVLLARPSPQAVTWDLALDQDWRVLIPSASLRDQEIAHLFSDGLIQHERGDDAAAVQSFEQVLASYPEATEAVFLRAICARDLAVKQGKPERATEVLPVLAKLADDLPNLVEARYEFGVTLRVLGRTEEAVRELERAAASRPDFAPAYHALGLAYLEQGERTKAREYLERYLALDANRNSPQKRQVREVLDQLSRGELAKPGQGVAFDQYSDWASGVAISYPKGWRVLSGAEVRGKLLPGMAAAQEVAAAIVDPANSDQNVNVRITPIESDALTDQDIAEAIPQLDAAYANSFPGFQKIRAEGVTIGGVKGVSYVFKSMRATVALQQCVVTLVKARKAYTVTFTARAAAFDRLWKVCYVPMLESFRMR